MPSTTRSSTAPMPSSMGRTPGWRASSYAAMALWLLGYPDQALESSQAALTLAQELAHPFSLAHALYFGGHAPSVPPGEAPRPRAGRGRHGPLDRAGICASGWRGERSCGAGRWPSRGRERRGSHRCARAWPPGGPRGQSWDGRIILPCWPRRMGRRADRGGACVLAEALAQWSTTWGALLGGGAVSAQGRTAAGAGCVSNAQPEAEDLLSPGPRHCPPPAGEVAGTTSRDEPEPSVAAPGQASRSPRSAGRVYGWFTEGFDTADLQEAKALLEALT